MDIGEVDMIVCYDAQKTPIRMVSTNYNTSTLVRLIHFLVQLQRVGRTGRKRAGRVEVLLSESREEANWDKAKNDYESVQASITRGDSIELYQDVHRLLPRENIPKCVEEEMPIYEYVVEPKLTKGTSKGTKRKRDVMRNIPDGAHDGFIASSKLLVKCAHKRAKAKHLEAHRNHLTDNEDVITVELGTNENLSPKDNIPSKSTKNKSRGKGSRKHAAVEDMSLSQLDRELQDDSDDMRIEQGIVLRSPTRSQQTQVSTTSPGNLSPSSFAMRPSSLETAMHRSHAAWLLDSDDDLRVSERSSVGRKSPKSRPPQSPRMTPNRVANLTPSSEASPIWRKRKQIPRRILSPLTTQTVQVDDSPARSPCHKKAVDPRTVKEFLDIEAEVSGEDASSSDPENAESESDRR